MTISYGYKVILTFFFKKKDELFKPLIKHSTDIGQCLTE